MKHLIFMRHAKAMKDAPEGGDFQRDLEERGKKDAALMGLALSKTRFIPDKLIASPARRCRKTAQIVSKELKLKENQIDFDSLIYEAGIEELMHLIHELNDQDKNILLIGHNPAFTSIIGYLTPTFAEHVPTSGIVVVGFDEKTWRLIQSRTGKVIWHQNPKGLPLV